MMTNAQKNFRELLAEKGVSLSTLARLLGATDGGQILRRDVVRKGRALPAEAIRIAEILGVSREEIDAVLSETAKRPGDRDARGRKRAEVLA